MTTSATPFVCNKCGHQLYASDQYCQGCGAQSLYQAKIATNVTDLTWASAFKIAFAALILFGGVALFVAVIIGLWNA